jgi:hypothetical protein
MSERIPSVIEIAEIWKMKTEGKNCLTILGTSEYRNSTEKVLSQPDGFNYKMLINNATREGRFVDA